MKKLMKSLLAVMLIVMMAVSFTSCGVPSDPAKATENLKKNEYVVIAGEAKTFGLEEAKVQAIVTASKVINPTDSVIIIYFKDAADAKEYHAKLKEADKGESKTDYVYGRSGKAVYTGHKDAVKAAK